MDVVATDPYVDAATIDRDGVLKASYGEVLDVADVVSLHAPLADETEGMVDAEAFDRIKEAAYLVNVARGDLVVETELVTALRDGDIAGARLDVFRHEPTSQTDDSPSFENPLREFDDVVLTPHVAWLSEEANDERRRTAARDVRRVLENAPPENPVNRPQ